MRKLGFIFSLLMVVCSGLFAQNGIPFMRNFTSEEYGAHNRNFDVVCDSASTPYFANFEGIIYFNGAQWDKILTPGISRITQLYKDREGRIWAGGYNYIGWIDARKNGTPILQAILSDDTTKEKRRIGEVTEIREDGDKLVFYSTEYEISYEKTEGKIDIVPLLETGKMPTAEKEQTVSLPDHTVLRTDGEHGLAGYNAQGELLFRLTEENGLCSNIINRITFDGYGKIWGATDNGVFSIQYPSFFTHFTQQEGLKGEVVSLMRYHGILYAGTLHGLFRFNAASQQFIQLPEVTQSCWQLTQGPDGNLYAATSKGVLLIDKQQQGKWLDQDYTLSVAFPPNEIGIRYNGEMDGIYGIGHGKKVKIAEIERATKMEFAQGSLWVETLYGEIFKIDKNGKNTCLEDGGCRLYISPEQEVYLMNTAGLTRADQLPAGQTTDSSAYFNPITDKDWWPGIAARVPASQESWIVNGSGRGIYVLRNKVLDAQKSQQLKPLSSYIVRTLYLEDTNHAWIGGDFGLIHIDLSNWDGAYQQDPQCYIRAIRLNRDSIYYGGYNQDLDSFDDLRKKAIFPSHINNFLFQFSTNTDNIKINAGNISYAYYLEGYESDWSSWQNSASKEYTNLSHGNYTFHVKTKDAFGRESAEKTFSFRIERPLYLTWYAITGYVMIAIGIILAIVSLRIQKLKAEKDRLEKIVENRTAEVVRQRDEITEKSTRLEKTLSELKAAQDQLIRQEKAAMMGKLTGGLIDRILNPLNYIINFSHLSLLLLKDMKEDIEDEKEHISTDNYEDMKEIQEMMNTHLSKIEEHGNSTSRILKAMEEMLAEHKMHPEPIDINHLCLSNLNILKEYYKKEIEQMHIRVDFKAHPENPLVEADQVQLGKSILSMLQNSLYAVRKEWEKQPYDGEIAILVRQEENDIAIDIRDNGIGIEPTILNKIFDPFFTTKTTSEAAGVGLYLSREIILSLHGTIEVKSEKDTYTVFTIKLKRYYGNN